MARDDHRDLFGFHRALRRLKSGDRAVHHIDAGNLTALDDVDAHIGRRPRVAPCDSIVTSGAAARLPEGAQHRIARASGFDDRADLLDLLRRDHLGRYACDAVGVGGALPGAQLMLCLRQHQDAAGAEHDVEVQLLAEVLIQGPGFLKNRGGGVLQIV